ncbi:hypothetical protein JCM10207_001559 [Rhodosporidiobolus poonsookiae]
MAPLPSLPASYSRITLRERPRAAINPDLSKDGKGTFVMEKEVPMWRAEDLKEGQVVVKVEWVSIDPAMRGWLNPTRSYVPPVELGHAMRAAGVGRIALLPSSSRPATTEDGNEKSAPLKEPLKVGDWVSGVMSWSEYHKMPVAEVQRIKIDDVVQPTYYLGALGMTGQTAYWGLHDTAKIQPGETVVVSGAAGAVGSLACQLAKLHGCRVIAIAGGKDKCAWIKSELGVDEVIDYKQEWKAFAKEFREKVGYLDVYFDNVGGDILDLCLSRLKKNARIALCGAISAYNDPSPRGLQMYLNLISQRAKIEGFIVLDYVDRYAEAAEHLSSYLRAGKLRIRETRAVGLDRCVDALVGLFEGKNTGKMVVRIGGEGSRL